MGDRSRGSVVHPIHPFLAGRDVYHSSKSAADDHPDPLRILRPNDGDVGPVQRELACRREDLQPTHDLSAFGVKHIEIAGVVMLLKHSVEICASSATNLKPMGHFFCRRQWRWILPERPNLRLPIEARA